MNYGLGMTLPIRRKLNTSTVLSTTLYCWTCTWNDKNLPAEQWWVHENLPQCLRAEEPDFPNPLTFKM